MKIHRPLIIAHRGLSRVAPENTIPAFHAAWDLGADGIEGDFHLTKDFEIVCIHNSSTLETTGVSRNVKDTMLSDLLDLNTSSAFESEYTVTRMPVLSEVLLTVPRGGHFFIELKTGVEIIQPMLNLYQEMDSFLVDQLTIISFDEELLKLCKKSMPKIKALLLLEFNKDDRVPLDSSVVSDCLRGCCADGVSVNFSQKITLNYVRDIVSDGFEFHVWDVEGELEYRQCQDLGVMSVTTDDVGLIKKFCV